MKEPHDLTSQTLRQARTSALLSLQGMEKDDCLSCRVTGTVTFAGVSAYMAYLHATTPKGNLQSRAFFMVFGVLAGSAAVWRARVD